MTGEETWDQLTLWMNGDYVPNAEARVSLFDRGFRAGDGVYESIRTVRGVPFKVEEHVDRLRRSMKYVRIDCGLSRDELIEIGYEVCRLNAHLLGPNGDLWLEYNVSRGDAPGAGVSPAGTVAAFCHPITFNRYNRHYIVGRKLYVPWIRQVPHQARDAKIKCLSLMHFALAQLEVYDRDPDASPLLLDVDGNVAEIAGGNAMIVTGGQLRVPPTWDTLAGITRGTTIDLARSAGIDVVEQPFQLYDVINADEVLLTTTSFCVLPVSQVNGIQIGAGAPGDVWRRLAGLWSELLGVDIVEQALAHLDPDQREALENEAAACLAAHESHGLTVHAGSRRRLD